MYSIYSKIAEIERQHQSAALCTIISTQGSTPRKTGTKMIVMADSSIFGTIGGGLLEKHIIDQAIEVIKSRQPEVYKHVLTLKEGMGCGGNLDIYIEPIVNQPVLMIFGAGHIGKILAHYSGSLDFSVKLIDERPEMFEGQLPGLAEFINKPYKQIIDELHFDTETYVVIMTNDHELDREILSLCLRKPHKYIGVIGSKAKIETAKRVLIEKNQFNIEELEQVNWPIGIGISCQTPEEIAISVMAKIIDIRRSN